EADGVTIRRPGWIEDLVDIRHLDVAFAPAARRVKDCQCRSARDDRSDGDPLAVVIPRASRVDELQAGVMWIAGGARQLPDNLAVRGIGYEQVDRKQAALREKRDPAAVGADRGADVQVAAKFLALDHQRPGFRWRCRDGRERTVGCT